MELVENLDFLEYAARESTNENGFFADYETYDEQASWAGFQILPQLYTEATTGTPVEPIRDAQRLREIMADLYQFRQSKGWENMVAIRPVATPDLFECSKKNQEKGSIYSNFYYDSIFDSVDQINYGPFF